MCRQVFENKDSNVNENKAFRHSGSTFNGINDKELVLHSPHGQDGQNAVEGYDY